MNWAPTKRKPRVLFMIDYYAPHLGWLEIVFENIITRLVKKWYEIGIITINPARSIPTYEHLWTVQIRRVGHSRMGFLRHSFVMARKIAHMYDIIHTTTYAAAIPARIVSRMHHKPVILTIHEVFGDLWKRYKPYGRKFFKSFEQMIFWFSYTAMVCVSDYTKHMVHRLYKVPLKKLHVIPNGIDPTVWTLQNRNTQWIGDFRKNHGLNGDLIGLYYGHSGASKGLDYYVQAIPWILEKYPNFKAILNIIPGKRDHKIYKQIQDLGIQNSVIILHGCHQIDLVNLVLLADFVVVPSISDGFGLVAAEVSQLEKPLIVTRNGALPEVASGKVVFLRTLSAQAIVESVEKVKNEQRHTVPNKKFDWDLTVAEYESMYRSCMNK